MATAATTDAIPVPGALYSAVDDLTSPGTDYGGNPLGLVSGVTVRMTMRGGRAIRGHEYAGRPVEWIRGTQALELDVFLQSTDTDGLASAFFDTFTGTSPMVTALRPDLSGGGSLASDDVATLLFAPQKPAAAPGVLFYAAVAISEPKPVVLRFADWPTRLVWSVTYTAFPRASDGKYAELALVADMSAP